MIMIAPVIFWATAILLFALDDGEHTQRRTWAWLSLAAGFAILIL